jgi:predicted enzyme related to lactoylglutathione lyase
MVRAAILATLALAFIAGCAHIEQPKSMPIDVGNDRVAWFDITTTNMEKSKDFYGQLFDWQFGPVPGTGKAIEIVSRGQSIGTIRVANGQIAAFNGVVYVQVADIQASCNKAGELGAKVVPGFPFNLSGRPGAICLFADPSGHPMGLYSRTPMPK